MKKSLLKSMLLGGMLAISMGVWAQKVGDVITFDGADYDVIGSNMVVNGSFDDGVTGWYAGNWVEANSSNYILHTDGGFDGGAYLEYSAGGASAETNVRNKWRKEKPICSAATLVEKLLPATTSSTVSWLSPTMVPLKGLNSINSSGVPLLSRKHQSGV